MAETRLEEIRQISGKKQRSVSRLLAAMEPHQVTFHWVKGHDGHPENERCDRLATTAADGGDLLEDEITE